MTSIAIPALRDGDNLSSFLRQVFAYPVLKAEEEFALAKKFKDNGDVEAAHKLVTSHLRLVVKIASGFRNYGLPFPDMISEGSIGLMTAVKKFEPERGFRLSTYAMWWIRAKIQEFILNSWSLVRSGSMVSRKKLFWKLRRIKAKLGLYEDRELTDEQTDQISQSLEMSGEDVRDINRWMSARDQSLNQPVTFDGSTEHIECLVDDSCNQEENLTETQQQAFLQEQVQAALSGLSERERDIIQRRILADEPLTLESLGSEYGVSRERIRQLEKRALKKLKDVLGNVFVGSD